MAEPDVFTLDAALPPGTRVAAYEAREALSETFSYQLWLLVPASAASAVDPAAVVLTPARFAIARADATLRRQVHGVIAALELLDDRPGGDALYRAELVPTVWRLKRSRHSRVWAGKTVREIVREVFLRAGLDPARFEDRLTGTYAPLPHVCQYRESDYDFVARCFEREGIYFTFEHSDRGDTLVYLDDRTQQTVADDPHPRYRPETAAGDSGSEGFRRFTQRSRYVARAVTLRDHDPLAPQSDLEATATIDDRRAPAVVRHMEDPWRDRGTGRRLARLRAEEARAPETDFAGEGRVFGLAPGQTFELADHPRGALNRAYLCTATHTRGRALADGEAMRRWVPWLDERTHWCAVTALPAEVQFRPARVTPRPRVAGVEVAHVDGPSGSEDAQLDEHGRYLVRFRFDESDGPDGSHSSRVRMLQPHAGSPEGMHLPLRKGTEVTVAFLAGDPDRPVITGAVPDADRPAAVTGARPSLHVIQTGGVNRWAFEDAAGAEHIELSTPPENTFLHLGIPHGDRTHHYVTSTDGDGLLRTGGDLDVTVGGDRHEHVARTLRETYRASLTSEVDGAVTEAHGADMTTTVTGPVRESARSHGTDVRGHAVERCASQRTEVTGHLEERSGTHRVAVDGRLHLRSGSHEAVTAGVSDCHFGALTVQVKGAFTLTAAGPIDLSALLWADNAPASYRIVTTKRQKVSREDITIHPLFFEAIGLKQSQTLASMSFGAWEAEVLMFARSVVGVQVDHTATSFSAVGAEMGLKGPDGKTFTLFGRTFGVALFA